jgi:ABC-type Fe3+/spermidine/putrescine transport system ATPase subunit
MMSILNVQNIHKHFADGVGVLHGIGLDVDQGEIASLLGPSGCGKTTLLRIIAGLEMPDRGHVLFDGRDMLSVPVHQRGFGLMFQDFALFPHKDVAANVAFGLRMQGLPAGEVERRVKEMLELVNLEHLAHRDVHQLSGGEQQRVALARSLAPRPRLLMLDEPMGSLDRTLRDRLLEELRHILKQVGVTVIYVTHDQSEAFAIADRVILMRAGQVIQAGRPEAVYRQPKNAWVARFMGMHNVLPGRWDAPGWVQTGIGPLRVDGCGQGQVTLLIRPEAAVIDQQGSGTSISGTLTSRSFRGALVHVTVQCAPGVTLAFDLPARAEIPAAGQPITLALQPEGIVCLSE